MAFVFFHLLLLLLETAFLWVNTILKLRAEKPNPLLETAFLWVNTIIEEQPKTVSVLLETAFCE